MQTIGERLEEARKKKGISIREAAEATKIRGDYLQKFESNHFDIGLTEIYTRGFLRTYANFLKVPADRILNDYAALGRGDVRPRQPSREVYGRMDITVASSGAEPAERGTTTEEGSQPEPSPANRGPQRSRSATSLPSGPDPATVFRYVKWGGAALILLVGMLLIWSLVSSGSKPSATGGSSTANPSPTPVAQPSGPTFGLVSSARIDVRVHRVNPDGSEGELLYAGSLTPGQVQPVAWPGDVFIESTAPSLLMVEVNGKRFPMGLPAGEVRGRLPAPPRR